MCGVPEAAARSPLGDLCAVAVNLAPGQAVTIGPDIGQIVRRLSRRRSALRRGLNSLH
jgi:hypothetical protein